ncbi:RecX family transcriptional regulator, partial [Patescibacteria group bacterium]|nr:RecX family transcriptional regulator [Patescibacteria group bacterium]
MDTCYQQLLLYALGLLSKRRYTEYGIYIKLKNKELGTEKEIQQVIDRLKELKYINDFSFAQDYIRTRVLLNPRGRRMLRLELKRKGIKKEIINTTIEEAEIDEVEIANAILKKKERLISKLSDQKKREKIFFLLTSRGVDIQSIY